MTPWKPWIGRRFAELRLLLLGESAYSWLENGEVVHPSAEHSIGLVEELLAGKPVKFMRTLSRGLTGEENPDAQRLQHVWDCVAFTNYVPGSVGEGAAIRPAPHMWDSATNLFPSLLAQLEPRRIIVLGKTMWSKMPPSDIYFTDDVQGYRLPSGRMAMCWAVDHPRGLSWRNLAAVIQFSCGDTLASR